MNVFTRKVILAWRWPLTLLVLGGMAMLMVLLLFVFAGSLLNQNFQNGLKTSQKTLQDLSQLLGGSTRVSLKESFLAGIPEISDAGGGRLELAKLERVEILKSEDRMSLFWDHFSLGTSIAEIRVPVTYRYYVNLDGPWEIEAQGNVCYVQAPRLRAMLPPAIHLNRMEKRSQNGWARFGAEDQLDSLEKDMLPTLTQYAENETVMILVRDQARKSMARFISNWFLNQFPDAYEEIKLLEVTFKDELPTHADSKSQPLMMPHE
jgi:hypothetical protein